MPTTIPSARCPLAVGRNALGAALGARRYACAHLLALRFPGAEDAPDSDDGMYGADVRGVAALLASTFAEASARLADALDGAACRHTADQKGLECYEMYLRANRERVAG
jgi:hypothetical protein